MESHFTEWLVRYGPFVLFFAQMFGIFGVPIPDELLLSFAGALIFQGKLNAAATITASIAGCLCGITLSFVLGRTAGARLLRKLSSRHLQIDRAQTWFRRFGRWVLAFGYFVPGVRHVTAIAAGAGSMDAWTFVLYAFPGGVLWCAVFLTLGYYAGNEWHTVAGAVESHVARAIVVTAFGVAALVVVKRHRGKREAQREIATEARRHRAH